MWVIFVIDNKQNGLMGLPAGGTSDPFRTRSKTGGRWRPRRTKMDTFCVRNGSPRWRWPKFTSLSHLLLSTELANLEMSPTLNDVQNTNLSKVKMRIFHRLIKHSSEIMHYVLHFLQYTFEYSHL
jgi:hypothetical protein